MGLRRRVASDRVEAGQPFDLTEDLDTRPRGKVDEMQQRQDDGHHYGIDGADPDDAEGRQQRQGELKAAEPIELTQRRADRAATARP